MSPSEILYVIYPQKAFFYGRNSERAFSRMIDLTLHPMNLANIAFDEPVRGPGWKCGLDTAGLLSQCENLQKGNSCCVVGSQRGKKESHYYGPTI